MFGLDWFTMVEVWGGLGNIYFPCMNGLVWIQLGSQPISRARWKALRRAVAAAASAMEKGRGGSSLRWAIRQGAAVRMDGEGKGGM